MLRMTFLTVGTLPKGPFSELAEGWEKQLKPFVKLEKKALRDEESIMRVLDQFAPSILWVLEADGKPRTSEQFAKVVETAEDRGDHVVVALGGPHGFSDSFKKHADLLLSLSAMTTTHDLAHLFFLEQLYRAFTILRGKIYHY